MATIAPDQHAPYVERLSLALLLPRYLFVGQVAMIGFFGVMILGVVGLMHQAGSPFNPFAAYADVLPGQPISGLDAHKFVCTIRDDHHGNPPEASCKLELQTNSNVFSRIAVNYSGGVIHLIHFAVYDDVLSLGDLAGLLDLREIRENQPKTSVIFSWHGYMGIATMVNRSQQLFAAHHIREVTLTDIPRAWRQSVGSRLDSTQVP